MLDERITYIRTFNAWLLKLITIHLQYLLQKGVLSQYNIELQIYHHYLYGAYGINRH